jgi:hypothetical protein
VRELDLADTEAERLGDRPVARRDLDFSAERLTMPKYVRTQGRGRALVPELLELSLAPREDEKDPPSGRTGWKKRILRAV